MFEPETLYIAKEKDGFTLIGTCRQSAISWIKENNLYNYPISESDLDLHPELMSVKKIIINNKKRVVGTYKVASIDTVTKPELNALGYPTRTSRHKADTMYILYSLEPCGENEITLDEKDFTPILGKGVSKQS